MFFANPLLVLDLFVVLFSIVCDVFLGDVEGDLLIVLRLWRMVRVAHGMFEMGEEKLEKEREKEEELEHLNELCLTTLSAAAEKLVLHNEHAEIVDMIDKVLAIAKEHEEHHKKKKHHHDEHTGELEMHHPAKPHVHNDASAAGRPVAVSNPIAARG